MTLAVIAMSAPGSSGPPWRALRLLVFSALGVALLAGSTDPMQLTVSVVLSSITGFVLAAYHRRSGSTSGAGIDRFFLGALANAAMLSGSHTSSASPAAPSTRRCAEGSGHPLCAGGRDHSVADVRVRR